MMVANPFARCCIESELQVIILRLSTRRRPYAVTQRAFVQLLWRLKSIFGDCYIGVPSVVNTTAP